MIPTRQAQGRVPRHLPSYISNSSLSLVSPALQGRTAALGCQFDGTAIFRSLPSRRRGGGSAGCRPVAGPRTERAAEGQHSLPTLLDLQISRRERQIGDRLGPSGVRAARCARDRALGWVRRDVERCGAVLDLRGRDRLGTGHRDRRGILPRWLGLAGRVRADGSRVRGRRQQDTNLLWIYPTCPRRGYGVGSVGYIHRRLVTTSPLPSPAKAPCAFRTKPWSVNDGFPPLKCT